MNQIVFNRIADEMTQIFSVSRESLDPQANLFELGLDSLMLIKLGQRLESIYHVSVNMSFFFTHLTTLEKIVGFIGEQGVPEPVDAVTPTAAAAVPGAVPRMEPPAGTTAVAGAGVSSAAALPLFVQQINSMQDLFRQQLETLSGTRIATPLPSPLPVPAGVPAVAAGVDTGTGGMHQNVRGLKLTDDELTVDQQTFVQALLARQVKRTARSRAMMGSYRDVLSDWKSTLSFRKTLKDAAYPIVSAGSAGATFRDVDGNAYIDIALGMGVHFFGHRHPKFLAALERQLAEGYELGPQSDLTGLAARGISRLTGCERVTFCNTGSETVMLALRLARAHTGRRKVVMFSGAYHGISDSVLAVREGDAAVTPQSPGTPAGMVEDLVILDYGTEESLQRIRELAATGTLAAVLVEPVQSRRPSLQPHTFLRKLRALTEQQGVALIFDEMVNGFRISAGGAQAHFNIKADMALYGKIIGGGMPIGIIGGKAAYLDHVDGGPWQYGDASVPETDMIIFGGTFCRHPLALASVCAAVELMEEQPDLQATANHLTEMLADHLNDWFQRESVPLRISYFGSQFKFDSFGRYSPLLQPLELDLFYMLLLEQGVYTWERRTCCLSVAHTKEDIQSIIAGVKAGIHALRAGGFAFAGGGQEIFRPLTSVERRLLAEMERKRDQGAYHMPAAWMVEGDIDADRLEIALGELVRRHDILRTSYRIVGGEFRARIEEEPRFFLERIDGAGRSPETILQDFIRPFDLSRAPLLRFALARLDGGRTLLMLDALHLALDGISMAGLAHDVQQAYDAQTLPPPPATYADYARTMQAFVASDDCRRQQAAWQQVLAGAESLVLPLDHPVAAVRERSVAGHVRIDLDAAFTDQLRAFSKQTGVSLFMTLAGAYGLLLRSLTGLKDVCIGTVASGRPSARFDHTLGMFANTLVLRLPSAAGASVAGYLKQVREVCIGAYANQDLPFEMLAEAGYGDLVQTMLTYENADEREFHLGANRLDPFPAEIPGSMFPCSLDIIETKGVLHLDFEFDIALLERKTVERWAGGFQGILKQFLTDPSTPSDRLTLVDKTELDTLRSFATGPVREIPEQSLASIFRTRAAATPDVQAVVAPDGTWSYRELDEVSDRIASALENVRQGKNHGVAVCCERSRWFPAAVLGILKAGVWYLPLLPDTPAARAAALLTDAGVVELLVNDSLVDACSRWGRPARSIESCVEAAGKCPADPATASDPAYVLYTSGSTGQPKGVMVEQRSVVNLVRWLQETIYQPLGSPVREGMLAQFVFDVSVQHLFGTLLNGHTLHILPEPAAADGATLRRILAESPLDLLDMTPSQFMLLTEQGRQVDFGPVRHLNFGAETLTRETLAALYARPENRTLTVCNMYGPTETCVQSASLMVTPAILDDDRPVAIGRPIFNTTIQVLDDDLHPVGIGTFGEIWIGGAGLARGYLGQEALTGEAFRETSFGRLYRSGDRGRWREDGCLEFAGRRDGQVKIMGHRIELGEIEAIARRHPPVAGAAAVVAGEGRETAVVLYVAPVSDLAALRMHLEANLPPYMVPRFLHALDVLPLTAGGKTDKRRLPKVSMEPDAVKRPFVPPAPGREQVVADVFARVLGQEPVGRRDSFFDLGGDSIKALQIVARLVEAGYAITVADVFQSRTVAALAASLKKKTEGARRGPYTGPAALAPMQRWFLEQHDAGRHHYNHALLFKVASLPADRVRQTVMLLWREHDALRARFTAVQSSPEQTIRAALPDDPVFAEVDLRDRPDARSALAEDAGQRQAAFSLGDGPLFQVVLYQVPDGQRLLFLAHHLVVDGVTWRILLADFGAAIQAFQAGQAPRLAPRSLPFAEWSNTVATLAAGGLTRTMPSDWRAAMEGTRPVFPGPSGTRGTAERVVLSVNDISEQDLSSLPLAAYGGHADELLLAAFLQALRQHTGAQHIGLLMEGHGRELPPGRVDLSRTAGWFTSLWPVCFPPLSATGTCEQLVEVKETSRAAARIGFDYSVLRYSKHGAARFAGLPEPDLSFNYLGRLDAGGSLLHPVAEPTGPDAAPELAMHAAMELDACFLGGEFRLEACVLPARVTPVLARSILQTTLALTREYLEACRNQQQRRTSASDCTCLPLLPSAAFENFCQAGGFPATGIDDCYPLTSAQEGMLFHAQQQPGSGAYFEQLWFDLEGNLSAPAFTEAWKIIVRRHPALRTVFRTDRDGRPLQVVVRDGEPEFTVHHGAEGGDGTRDAWIEHLIAEDRARPFDLEHGPLVRCRLLCRGGDRWRFVLSYSHLIADGWCTGLLLSELITLYADAGHESSLPEPVPYSRFIAARQEADDPEAQAFWQRHMEGAVRTGIATTRQSGERQMRSHTMVLDPDLVHRIEEEARRSGTTPGALFQAAWSLMLARHNRRDDVTFGLVVSGRSLELPGIEEIIGLCIETLPARARLAEGETLTDIARRMQESQWAMEQHPSTALAGLGVGAVLDHILVFENYPMDATIIDRFAAAGLRVSAPGGYEQVEYNLSVEVNPGRSFGVTFHYNAAVYEDALFPELARQLTGLFTQFAEMPTRPVKAYRLDWPVVSALPVVPPFVCVTDSMMALAAAQGEAEAFVWQGRPASRADLLRMTKQLAAGLVRNGLKRGDVVCVPMERSAMTLPVILGIWMAGGVYLPLDPASGEARLSSILEEHPEAVRLSVHDGETIPVGPHRVWSVAALLQGGRDGAERFPAVGPQDVAYLLYTSGSTGRPKGVVVGHAALSSLAAWVSSTIYRGLTGPVRETWIPPLHFDASFHSLLGVVTGGHSLLIPDEAVRNDPEALLAFMGAHGSRVANTTPTYFSIMLDLLGDAPWPGDVLILGAESIPSSLMARFYANPANRRVVVYNLYGPTETCVEVAWHRMTVDDWMRYDPIPIGRAIAGASLEIRDAGGCPAAVGVPGEIRIGGVPVAHGYYNRPEETAAAFENHPDNVRSYRTGDWGRRLPDGSIVFLGRTDRQLKLRGFRIEPGEIESRLMQGDGVTGAAVVSLEVADDRQVIMGAFLVGQEPLNLDAIRARLTASLPGYMVPEHFQQIRALPLNANHKLDEAALRGMVEIRARLPGEAGQTPLVPANETEALLVELWKDTLQVAPATVDQSFFDAGGNSLAAMRLAGRIRARFGRAFSIRALYEAPQFRAIAARLGDIQPSIAATPSAPVAENDDLTEDEKRLLEQA